MNQYVIDYWINVPDGTYTNGISNIRRPIVNGALNLPYYMKTYQVTI